MPEEHSVAIEGLGEVSLSYTVDDTLRLVINDDPIANGERYESGTMWYNAHGQICVVEINHVAEHMAKQEGAPLLNVAVGISKPAITLGEGVTAADGS